VAGLADRLTAGIAVADVGCGLGASTRILADAYPSSSVRGFDPHVESIDLARKAAGEAALDARCDFAVAHAQDFPGTGYGLVATFDCLHDMGDPLAAARHIRSALSDDGVWLIVEPFAGESPADNLTPVGRIYYSFSTFLCVPHAISEGADDALGNQAGESRIRPLVQAAGFRTFRRAAETPFNLVYEARP
jgi:SAM-dependent methyltransferase